MDNEIKEILKEIECYQNEDMCIIMLSQKENKALLDYITNLQQENENLKDFNAKLQATKDRLDKYDYENTMQIKELQQENEELKEYLFKSANNTNMIMELYEDYKSRCEKAIEYINDMLYPIGTCVNGSDLPYESIESLLNILQNGSE